jgi:hypothetical protein
MTDRITTTSSGATVFEGSGIEMYRLTVIASALDLYAKTGIKANTSYTPTNMPRAATEATGVKYRRGQYREAAADLRKRVEDIRSTVAIVQK